MTIAHNFVGIVVIPVEAQISAAGELEVREPEDADRQPQYVCQVCWIPLTAESLFAPCAGPKIPDDLSTMPPVPDKPTF